MQFHPQFLIDLQFTNMSTYKVFMKGESFLCEYCGYLRNYTHHSDQHLKTHPDFECNYCGYSTNYKENLKIHNTTAVKPFSCNYCKFSTNYKESLNHHLKTHNTSTIKPFSCNYCKFSTNYSFKRCRSWMKTLFSSRICSVTQHFLQYATLSGIKWQKYDIK